MNYWTKTTHKVRFVLLTRRRARQNREEKTPEGEIFFYRALVFYLKILVKVSPVGLEKL